MHYQAKHALGLRPKTCRIIVKTKIFYFTMSLCTEAGCPEEDTETI